MLNKKGNIIGIVLVTFISTVILIAVSALVFLIKVDFPYKNLLSVISTIESSYVDEYDRNLSEESAINAVLESIDDKYALYYNKDNFDEVMNLVDGKYIGIGAEVFANTQKDRVEIISAFEDSPAYKAGLKSGDLIKNVDGKEYTAAELTELVLYLKGVKEENPFEKTLSIVIIRENKEFTVELKREEVNQYKVKSQLVDDICYIRYTGFTETSYNDFKDIMENMDSSVEGIVIDIRDNPGGDFDSVIAMCDLFLDDETIMYTVDKDGEKKYFTAEDGSYELPLAVIVNGSSASAAEVFAGSIKANKRGVIVGEKTYGKGVTQTVFALGNPLDPEGALKLTTYKNYTPDGNWINEGITPDVEVPTSKIADDIKKDQAFIAAVKSLKKDK